MLQLVCIILVEFLTNLFLIHFFRVIKNTEVTVILPDRLFWQFFWEI